MKDFISKNSTYAEESSYCKTSIITNDQNPSGNLAYPVDTSVQLSKLLEEYSATGKPIPVSFRALVSWLPKARCYALSGTYHLRLRLCWEQQHVYAYSDHLRGW